LQVTLLPKSVCSGSRSTLLACHWN